MSSPSGPGTHIREVIRAFEAQGNEVVKWIVGGETLQSGQLQIQFKRHLVRSFIPDYIWHSLKDWKLKQLDNMLMQQLCDKLDHERPDFIYERSYYLMTSGARAAKKLGIPYFCEINAPYPQEKIEMEGRSWWSSAAVKAEQEQTQSAHTVVTVSTALRDYFVEQSGIDAGKVLVTPNAVRPEAIHVNQELVTSLRNKMNDHSGDFTIGFVGSIFPYHGVDLLVDVFLEMASEDPRLKLVIVGDGETLPELKSKAQNSNQGHRILFAGNVPHDDVYSYIDLMDVTVMARSNWYGSPVKIFEYGAMKKCIIAPDVIPVRDVMVDKQDGLIIPPTTDALRNAISFCIHQPKDAQRMAESFYKKVMQQHTWLHVGQEILNRLK